MRLSFGKTRFQALGKKMSPGDGKGHGVFSPNLMPGAQPSGVTSKAIESSLLQQAEKEWRNSSQPPSRNN
jgi:hypothetical protein